MTKDQGLADQTTNNELMQWKSIRRNIRRTWKIIRNKMKKKSRSQYGSAPNYARNLFRFWSQIDGCQIDKFKLVPIGSQW